ncbi:hypothetical protein PVK06_039372 [Gossypium arboreum]|uniref:Retrotransposon Copia-like N-terminal domain-containing protein n=1 Tax=Gossypium arboreum TaxID=29729 RepID=A0ABR0N2P5_GOSAR|nr:hypothetical protein PVK06_039372 [Gossypium arboreum]
MGGKAKPGDFFIPTRLKDDNYDDWAAEIETALQARRKFGFLDGMITAPIPPCIDADWTTIHAMLVSWIMNTITIKMISEVKDEKPATVGFALCSSGKGRGRIEKVDKSHLLCTHCKKIGHEVRGTVRANATTVTAFDSVVGLSDNNITLAAPPSSFTAEQWKALASVFGNLTISNYRLNGMFNKRL